MKRFLTGVLAGAALAVAVVSAVRPALAQEGVAPAPKLDSGEPAKLDSVRELSVRVTPEMVRYSYTRYALYFVGTVAHAAALLLLLRGGISARLRDLAERKSRNRLVQALIYYPLLTLAYGAVTLPLSFYSSFLLPHQYGLSNQKLHTWVLDGAKGYAISSLVGAPVIALLYWTLRRSPRRWWVGFWLASIPLLVMAMLLGPLLIDPLFNKFQPLRNERLRERILALAGRAGIERGRVLEVDASRRTQAVNAYVTGIGGSARIVLWDTLLQKLDEDEVSFVMAHEMGHYVEHHVPLALLAATLGTGGVLLIADRSGRWLIRRYGSSWRVRSLDDLASLPVLLLIVMAVNFFGNPVESAISRHFEGRADTFALQLTGDGQAGASSFVKLSEKNLSLPDPPVFIKLWMFSHPPLKERIDKALAYDQAGR